MDDDGKALRGIIARSFGMLAASVHAKDPEHQRNIAEGHAYWILTGSAMPETSADVRRVCDEKLAEVRAARKKR